MVVTAVALTTVVAMLLACLAYREAANASILRDLLSERAVEQAAQRAQVEMLLQRIQAPTLAVTQYATGDTEPENTYPLDDSEQAEAQDFKVAAEAVLAQIRERENEMNGVA